jgi:putative spermidine/putrescine transport system ATP-binding protein
VCGTDEFIVKVPNAHGHQLLGEGNEVWLGWQMDDCRALDPAPTA